MSAELMTYIDLLGRPAVDRITGYRGTITCVTFDLYGCVQVIVTPPVDKDGKVVVGHFFDVHRLTVDRDGPRAMAPPTFQHQVQPQYGVAPEQHAHGPAEKPEPVK